MSNVLKFAKFYGQYGENVLSLHCCIICQVEII